MQSESLVVPLLLLKDRTQGSAFIEKACYASSPTKLLSWGLDGAEQEAGDKTPIAGAAMGCEDGSVYLFSADITTGGTGIAGFSSEKPAVSLHAELTTLSSPSSRPSSPKSPSHSRHGSNSMHVPHPLSHPTRSRVTSSVSKTSAEAPRNYVDFDDEKEKLEEMIKNGPPVKEKSVTDGLRVSYAIAGLGFGRDESKINGGGRRASKRLSFPGSTTSASGTPRDSLSSPPSPSSPSSIPPNCHPPPTPDVWRVMHGGMTPHLTLRSHFFPPHFGIGCGVVCMKRLSTGILLSLQETGTITVISIPSGLCLAALDLESTPRLHPPPPPAPSTFSGTAVDHATWSWKFLHVVETLESTILLVTASDQASIGEDFEPRMRVAVLQLQNLNSLAYPLDLGTTTRHGALQKVGEWIMPGLPETTGLFSDESESSPIFFYVTPGPSSRIVTHSLQIVPQGFVITVLTSLQQPPDALSSAPPVGVSAQTSTTLPNLSLPIPNPFKPKISGGEDNEPAETVATTHGRVIMGDSVILGPAPSLEGNRCTLGIQLRSIGAGGTQGVLWNDTNFLVFETRDSRKKALILASTSHCGVALVERLGNEIFVLHQKKKVDVYRVPLLQEISTNCLEHLSSRMFSKQCHPSTAISSSLLLCSRPKADSGGSMCQRLAYMPVQPVASKARGGRKTRDDECKARNAWFPSTECRPVGSHRRVTSLLPLEIELIILGYSDGSIGKSSLSDLLTMGWPSPREKNSGINGFISSLHPIKNQHASTKLVVGGVDDGGITVWDLSTLQLRKKWTIFTEPLRTVVSIEDDAATRLKGCIICISEDGTLAVIAVDGLELLYLIPGSAARLTRLCLSQDNLLLVYADAKARLWDIKTQEFWRSMTSKTADELLRQESWLQVEVEDGNRGFNAMPLSLFQRCFSSHDAAATLLLNIRALNDLIHPLPPSHLFRDPRREDTGNRARDQVLAESTSSPERASRRLKLLKTLLGSLLSFGLDNAIDETCREKLGITPSLASIGLFSNDSSTTVLSSPNACEIWQISPEHTASRLLTLVTVLRGLLAFDEECEPHASQVITFYVASLRDTVGPLWQEPSLSFLARYWFHSSSEIRLAARALFGATVDRLSDDETIRLVERWQHELPCLQPDAEKQSAYSALSLLITGNIAAERYAVLAASTLTDIAKSITIYLHDETCPHRLLAIDLCSRGFQIWQNYVDAMEVLRALFALSTSAEKERNTGPQARLAVLQIASSNTPLFMTTLSLDILQPRSLHQRKSIMQLVAFLIRKRPLVLYPNLPRLVEAVVKSLDPSSSSNRDAVFDAATEILGQVVKTFPSVDFHMQSQRLCVGTSEGAVVMYDLKTATRLYVLEGHNRRLGACSFSPDGRRLVTVSLEEGLVRVWKVGSSITSLFMPGAPPRQGHAGSDPYKTLNFNVGDEAHMTVATILELVRFEWPAERTARLKIRDSAFTFNT